MALAYSTRRVTKDIDAVFEPKIAIYEAAARVAERLGLPADWLNDAVKAFLPGADPEARPLPEIRGIEVTTASARYLLAMKLLAMRFGEDDDDIRILLGRDGNHDHRGCSRSPHADVPEPASLRPRPACSSKRCWALSVADRRLRLAATDAGALCPQSFASPWQCFHLRPLPQVHGSLRPRRASSAA